MDHKTNKKEWDIIQQLWKYRSDALHNIEAIHLLSSLDSLKGAIISEYTLVQDILHGVYSSYFHILLQSLLSKSTHYLNQWFLVICAGREASTIATAID